MRIAFILAFVTAQTAAGMALAQTAAEQAACQANFQEFCKGVKPGDGRIIQCLNEHFDKLTPECQKIVKANTPG
ncbi:MAG: cysteine rich repeat-containing protein [Rhizobiaceae bacterium]